MNIPFYEDPIFWASVAAAGGAIIGAYWVFRGNQRENTQFSTKEYTDEVKKIILAIHDHYNSFGDFASLLTNYPELGRQTLQHIYTFDENIFKKLKETFVFQKTWQSQKHDERDDIFNEFASPMSVEYHKIEYETHPEFGTCKNCLKYLNKKQKTKYQNLENVEDDFWDWTKW